MRKDRRTGMMKLIAAFNDFVKGPKNIFICCYFIHAPQILRSELQRKRQLREHVTLYYTAHYFVPSFIYKFKFN